VSEVETKCDHSYNNLGYVVVEFTFKLEVSERTEDIRHN
jgi:hypothetical protein